MATIKVRDFNVEVDIEKEIGEYSWSRARWLPERLIANSPFRYDSSPSFYVYFHDTATAKAGSWGDSGGTGDFKKGSFVKLLSFLRNESEYDTEEYLLATYAREYTEDDELVVDFSRLRIWEKRGALPIDRLDKFEESFEYLESRGVAAEIARSYGCRYDVKGKTVVFPWYFPDGRLANIKYRKADSKIFFYEEDGYPLLELVYGLQLINRLEAKIAVLTEAEIDAMYVKTITGVDAIAAGTSKLSDEKAEAIARSSIEEIIILADNDAAGEVLKQQAIEKLSMYDIRIRVAELPQQYKDANDVKDAEILKESIKQAKTVTLSLFG